MTGVPANVAGGTGGGQGNYGMGEGPSSGSGWGVGAGQSSQGESGLGLGTGQVNQGLWEQLPDEWKKRIQGGSAGAGGVSRLG